MKIGKYNLKTVTSDKVMVMVMWMDDNGMPCATFISAEDVVHACLDRVLTGEKYRGVFDIKRDKTELEKEAALLKIIERSHYGDE